MILDYKTRKEVYERAKGIQKGIIVVKTPYYYRRYGGMYNPEIKEYFIIQFSRRVVTKYKVMILLQYLFKYAKRLGIYINFDRYTTYEDCRYDNWQVKEHLHQRRFNDLAIKLLADGQHTFYKDHYSGTCKIQAQRLRFDETRINHQHEYKAIPFEWITHMEQIVLTAEQIRKWSR